MDSNNQITNNTNLNTDTSKFNIVISPTNIMDPSEIIDVMTANEILALGFVKFLTTAFLSPFEVARMLQQIQYIPTEKYIKKNEDINYNNQNENENNEDKTSQVKIILYF